MQLRSVWLEIVKELKTLADRAGVELPAELHVNSGDLFRRQIRRLELVLGFLKAVNVALNRPLRKAETEPERERKPKAAKGSDK